MKEWRGYKKRLYCKGLGREEKKGEEIQDNNKEVGGISGYGEGRNIGEEERI